MNTLEHLEPRRFLSAGQLDPSVPGLIFTFSPAPGVSQLRLFGEDANGRLTLAGTTLAGGGFFSRITLFTPPDTHTPPNTTTTDSPVATTAVTYDYDVGSGAMVVADFPGIHKYTADGLADTSFGDQGAVQLGDGSRTARAIAFTPDGGVVAAALDATGGATVWRFNADGSPDATWNGTGSLTIPNVRAVVDIEVAQDGGVLVGYMNWDIVTDDDGLPLRTNTHSFARLYTPSGAPDNGFGSGGVIDLTARADIQAGVLDDVGFSELGVPFALASTTWVNRGPGMPYVFAPLSGTQSPVRILPPGAGTFVAQGAMLDAAGRITIFGTWDNPTARETFVSRFLPDGKVDLSFGERGLFHVVTDAVLRCWPSDDGGVWLAGSPGNRIASEAAISIMKVQGGTGAHDIRINRKGTLIVNTNNSSENVQVYIRGRDGRLIVRVDDFAQSFTMAKVKKIAVSTFAGDDTTTIGAGVIGTYVDAGDGRDTIYGGQFNDILVGGTGPDRIFGFDGNDTLLGGGGNDYCLGGAGKDDLFGNAGIDTLSGAGGNDRLFGGSEADKIFGGAGSDLAANSASDSYDGVETFL